MSTVDRNECLVSRYGRVTPVKKFDLSTAYKNFSEDEEKVLPQSQLETKFLCLPAMSSISPVEFVMLKI
jgi:hypothetical protein